MQVIENNIKRVSLTNSKDLIYKSNSLARSKYDITLVQARFIAFMSSLVDKTDDDFFTYQIQIKPVLDFLDIERANLKYLSSTLKQLQTTLICLEDNNEAEAYATFLSYFKLDKKNDLLEFRFDSSLKKHYIELQNNFTAFELSYYKNFESVFTIKIYELIKSNYQLYKKYNNNLFKEFIVNVDEFRNKIASKNIKGDFQVPKSYLLYKNFKSNVLEVARKELLEKCDIYFEYEEIKNNRAVVELKIKIIQNQETIKKDFIERKNQILKASTKHKQIAQEQIKRLMSRNKDKIKYPLKYEQKLTRMFLNGTLVYDKDLQLIIDELDKKIFNEIGNN